MDSNSTHKNPENCGDSIGSWFEEVVDRYGARLAYRDTAIELTYRELNIRSAAITQRLLMTNSRSATPIAILASGGVNQLLAVLGVLKAGRCSFVIDPAAPDERVIDVIKHSGAELLVCDNRYERRANSLNPYEAP